MERSLKKRIYGKARSDGGAVAVEFAFTMLFLFLLVCIFMQIAGLFIAHERLSLAAFAASRTFSTEKYGGALGAAYSIESGIDLRIGSYTRGGQYRSNGVRTPAPYYGESEFLRSKMITLTKRVDTPIDLRNILSRENASFTISKTVVTLEETDPGGDN